MNLKTPRKLAFACALLAGTTLIGVTARPQPAQARVFVGIGIGVPFYHPYVYRPYYYAPAPVYYAPPPAYYYAPPALGYACHAGPYICPTAHARPLYAHCACPAEGGGRIPGQVE